MREHYMRIDTGRKARLRLDERLMRLKPVEQLRVPPQGWIRAIREALGMSGVQFAKRLGVSPQSAHTLERSEANGSIKLETLRKAAEALDCTLVYALVPNTNLVETVDRRARALAKAELNRVSHSMNLEAQGVAGTDSEQQIEDYIRTHLNQRDLWQRP